MILAARQYEASVLPRRLQERLGKLGFAIVRLESVGRASAIGSVRWIESVVLKSAMLNRQVGREWSRLADRDEPAVELLPGVWLVPLTRVRRRRGVEASHQPLLATLLLSPDLLHSEQLRSICSEQGIDLAYALSQVDANALVPPQDVARLSSALSWMHEDALEIDRQVVDLQQMSRELAESYEELSLLYKLSSNMNVNRTPREFLTEACEELQQVVGLRWLALQLIEDEPRLEDLRGQLFAAVPPEYSTEELKHIGHNLLERYGLEREPVIVDDTRNLDLPPIWRLARDLLIIPLRSNEGRPLGILFGGDKAGVRQITSGDSKLCDSLASSLTIFLQNTMLYGDVQAMFYGTLHALTSAIDAKDSYTHGHSERVALMSRLLAEAVGLDAATQERVFIAGMVHDVGKIGVPEAVLTKPGRLTQEEFAQVKLHPEIGAKILQDIRQMHDLIPGVLYHHEQWDGSGYPHGLSGEEIPLFGRLVGLADAFDAMSSDRTYRAALKLEEVLAEIRRCAGKQFDPVLAEAFLTLDFEPYYRLIRKHQDHKRK